MFKKALQIAVTFSLLVGGYAGYTRLFAVAAALLGDGRGEGAAAFPEVDSASAQKANELARESFGPGHWAARKDLKLLYYEASRGFYMYAENYERLNDGKRLHIWPFAEISVSADGKSRKMITSDEAWIDLSQPFGMMSKPGTEPSHIVHATLLGNVRIRDDKGTRDDLTDDLRVGPMAAVDYDDKTLQITSESDIILEDRDLRLTGIGMMIQLRRKVVVTESGGTSSGSGFETETAFVYKDVHIVVNNVGSNGILPGTAKPEKTGKTPLDLRCDREMRIDFPKARAPLWIGPPDLDRSPDPTFAKFKTNVRVLRGTDKTDQLNCDTLDLTLMPNPKPPVTEEDGAPTRTASARVRWSRLSRPRPEDESDWDEEAASPASTSGPLTDLKLRKAFARGDAVWLQSEASGLVARCSELHYEKHVEDGAPDITYLNGGLNKKLWVEKVDYDNQAPTPGAIKSIMRLISVDATIFDFGPGGTSKVLARGPGKMEERPARNASVTRTAWFEDEMQLLTWRDGEAVMPSAPPDAIRALKSAPAAAAQGDAPPPRHAHRRLETGRPQLGHDPRREAVDRRRVPGGSQGEARRQGRPDRDQVARRDRGRPPDRAEPDPDGPTVPQGQVRDAAAAAQGPGSGAGRDRADRPDRRRQPDLGTGPGSRSASRADRRARARHRRPGGSGLGRHPARRVRSQGQGGRQVQGRAQERPAPGRRDGPPGPRARQAAGERPQRRGPGHHRPGERPDEVRGQGRGAPAGVRPQDLARLRAERVAAALTSGLARVDFEGKTIESEKLIVLDQKADYAWTQGAGNFIQMADRGLLDDKGIEGEKGKNRPIGPNPKDRLVITWTEEMRFYGRSRDLAGRPAAKIEFRGASKEVRTVDGHREYRRGVEAKMTNSLILCDSMDVYMDRTIDLNKDTRKPDEKKPDDPASSDAQIAMLDCRGRNVCETRATSSSPASMSSMRRSIPRTASSRRSSASRASTSSTTSGPASSRLPEPVRPGSTSGRPSTPRIPRRSRQSN